MAKNPPASAGDTGDAGSIPGSGRAPGGGHGNPLQYSCQDNPMDRGPWWATAHGVAESDKTESEHIHCLFSVHLFGWGSYCNYRKQSMGPGLALQALPGRDTGCIGRIGMCPLLIRNLKGCRLKLQEMACHHKGRAL